MIDLMVMTNNYNKLLKSADMPSLMCFSILNIFVCLE